MKVLINAWPSPFGMIRMKHWSCILSIVFPPIFLSVVFHCPVQPDAEIGVARPLSFGKRHVKPFPLKAVVLENPILLITPLGYVEIAGLVEECKNSIFGTVHHVESLGAYESVDVYDLLVMEQHPFFAQERPSNQLVQ